MSEFVPGEVRITSRGIDIRNWKCEDATANQLQSHALMWAFRRLGTEPKFREALTEALAEALVDPYEEGEEDPEWGIPGTCRACTEDTLWMRDARIGAAAIVAHLLGEA